jgi:hypothetical protein
VHVAQGIREQCEQDRSVRTPCGAVMLESAFSFRLCSIIDVVVRNEQSGGPQGALWGHFATAEPSISKQRPPRFVLQSDRRPSIQ